ncbi:sedoheptulose 7-phosphate cyclase [Streptomyces sp. ZAF1911]|uniref:sedoheptulose 7-phosphate cyclase n=1 Tax=Streptomyces sp. ZAF1911 TaxID=2944129 RepID=UPI00237BDDBA|nr:sedoheptulose 7-phosphate cyclase [Streptomyces sp. ZAF1911]MDD9376880.1 sedoheptulose 7-phosphate cyclase [Streptomyces sp. ZAF1911]
MSEITTARPSSSLTSAFDIPRPPGLTWFVQSQMPVGYEVSLTRGLLNPANPVLARSVGADGRAPVRALVVVDQAVDELYGPGLRGYFDAWQVDAFWKVMPGDEETKNLDQVVEVTRSMTEMGILRRTERVVVVGGGVLMDVVGMAASLYRRGAPYVRVPTTLVGQVDAGVGVKTGVNHGTHKNRLGTYFAPEVTLIDPEFLRTVEPRHIANGLAEIIKMALIKDGALFDLLEENVTRITSDSLADCGAAMSEVVSRAIAGMLDELEPNLWEGVLERSVDYGHTFSPSLELRADPPLLHGEAVGVDMAVCLALAAGRGYLSEGDAHRALALIAGCGLPLTHPVFTPDLLTVGLADAVKHRDGAQRLPLTNGIGSCVFVNDITADELARALEFVRAYADGSRTDGPAQ